MSTAAVDVTATTSRSPERASRSRTGRTLGRWWPLAVLTLLAAALRLSTLDLQSFWYDEAFTPVHVLHPSLWATLRSVAHTENTPPLWYVIAWADSRVLGTGEVALRLPSALAGIATVPVGWAIGDQLAGRRAAIITAALVAVNPLFVWYSQEARAYALFVLTAALAMLCFLRAQREPTRGRMAAFALAGSLALLTHYFAVFLLIGMVVWLLYEPARRRAARGAIAALAVVGLALVPLISTQGGHGTQWIGQWALSSRLLAIPQYYLTGYSGAPLGHGVELLVALPILAGLAIGLSRMLDDPRALRGARIALSVAAAGIVIPVALVAFGADYLAPRNLVAAMIPVTAVVAVALASADRGPRGSGRVGTALAATIAVAFLAVSVDVDLSPRLQRGNWRDVARALRGGDRDRVVTTVELGSAPLEYYLPPLQSLPRGAAVSVGEIDETGYAPLLASAGSAPAPGFHLLDRLDIDGLIVYRFVAPVARRISEATLRRDVITLATPEVLVPAGVKVSLASARVPAERARRSSAAKTI